jgi:UDP-N-acetylmuramate--alanine ligase
MTHVHFVGIGGTGLSAIARLLLESGYTVSGSDRQVSPLAQALEASGAQVFIGHRQENIKGADLIVRSSAVPDDNPEVVAARQTGVPVLKRVDFLGHLLEGHEVIAVAGTHGKTTTTAMIAWTLTSLMQEPSFIIGGVSTNLGSNAQAGKGPIFVIEADEYDRMFLGIHPKIAVVTYIEHDHPDCFPTPEDFYQAFKDFINGLAPRGILVACGDDPGAARLAREMAASAHLIVTYGLCNSQFTYYARNLNPDPYKGGFCFDVYRGENLLAHLSLQVPGEHNVTNALATLAVVDQLDLPNLGTDRLVMAAEALNDFLGTGRRFEVRGEVNGITVIDDYAHHPTEIETTLSAARTRYPGRKLWVIWQPHTYSRITALFERFTTAFKEADHVIVTDVYAAREALQTDSTVPQLVKAMSHPDARFIPDFNNTVDHLKQVLKPGDVLLVLSAGDADKISTQILEGWRREETSQQTVHVPLKHPLKSVFGERLLYNIPMATYTAARIGGPADFLLVVYSAEELVQAAVLLWQNETPFIVLGSVSNALISDAGVRGVVLINRARRVKFSDQDPMPYVWSESGANLGIVARLAARRGLSGLEWAAGIPGTIGGAVIGNAGAHGADIAHQLIMVEILQQEDMRHLARSETLISASDLNTLRKQWPVDHMKYEYRSSELKRNPGQAIILSASLRLQFQPSEEILAAMEHFLGQRRWTQPSGASMGSMFKNPPGDYAGRLIEAAGLKGKRISDAEISPLHANFFVNLGQATAANVWDLIQLAQKTVMDKFGINLDLEVELLGDWDKDINH